MSKSVPNPAGAIPAFELTSAEVVLSESVRDLAEPALITRADLAAPGPTIIAASAGLARLTGYAAADLLGRSPRLFQGPLTDPVVLARLRTACERGDRFVGESVNYRRDGSSYLVNWTVDPVRDAEGRVTHFFSLQRDVTDRRPYAREWMEAERRAESALATVSAQMALLAEAIATIERTKRSFRSKELAALRARLTEAGRGFDGPGAGSSQMEPGPA
jgi:PAS domain S-box-containing protein